jgi:hypothetical protein
MIPPAKKKKASKHIELARRKIGLTDLFQLIVPQPTWGFFDPLQYLWL